MHFIVSAKETNVSFNIHFKFRSEGDFQGLSLTLTLFGLLALMQ